MRRQSTKLLTVPVHVTDATAPAHGLPRWAVKTRPHRRPVVAGVHVHPSATRRIRVPAWADDRWIEQRNVFAAVQTRRPDAVLSHLSAARHLGWPIDGWFPWTPVSVTSRTTGTTIPGLRRHKPRAVEFDDREGIAVVIEPEVLRQISSELEEDELVEVIDAICGLWSGPKDGSVTPHLAYPDLRIAIEYEGDHHRTDRIQWSHDIERERWVCQEGWDYIRVTAGMPDGLIVHVVREAICASTRGATGDRAGG